ncbi:hypothetical protein [Bradyrhizobium diazoefficiens]|uniref:hypothetical protein n=1 Tax=Bradyrhizobium diazoefficiens TaxID=1355477 RepID=UPI0013966B29|nr:hypothetical protein [Bradyrhizobium diazoefficiens]
MEEEIMATITFSRRYSATYSVDKSPGGWVAEGRIWETKDGKQLATSMKFRANGNTRQAATDAAIEAARDACPDEDG